ncbi:hypothetical protein [Citrobacter phage CVT22]|uniref:Uncharacterized protein n=1 Tax=Citrobacter phage CVT22 TaxID=1622234 RepID=A0A0R6CA84_9CAUD|nr:hypothetical protein APL39_gp78 [Citrobacter phage CVT22]AJT60781.2 hypothetical protein [Citrobacter phage CVT22]
MENNAIMKAYLVTLYQNPGWGLRFDNYDRVVDNCIFTKKKDAHAYGIHFERTGKYLHKSYTVKEVELRDTFNATSSS